MTITEFSVLIIWVGGVVFLGERNDSTLKTVFWPFYLGQHLAESVQDELSEVEE